MPLEARIDVADHWYHIVARGQRREALFLDAKDKATYLEILSSTLDRNIADLGAYCLMTNHVHLLVYRRDRSLGTIFRQAHRAYAIYFNRRHRKNGYVFQGRPKSYLVLDERYLLALLRYIHGNPLEAGMVRRIEDYRWSSDWFYRGGDRKEKIRLTRVPGFEGRAGARAYRELLEGNEDVDVPRFEQFVGEKGQEKRIQRRKAGREQWFRKERRGHVPIQDRIKELLSKVGMTLEAVRSMTKRREISEGRQQIMSKLYAEGYPPSEIAKLTSRSVPAVILSHTRKSAKC